MIEVVSIKFKNRGKCYFFSPNGLTVKSGERVIVETSKGLEIADCCCGNHFVPDTAVVQPLRPVVRVATADDLRIAELNKKREKEAFDICQEKIEAHGLDMKLVDVECNFDGSKTMFFFTSDGRVDFRELVKDLAGIFRNRIELRQIGVRDEAKMIGGIGICGRPYCCNQFLDDFQPVSTKMAKVQSLSLNPTKISGSCGRLMCCLRYEQDAYEDLLKKVPKQGAYVETKDGFGTAVQVNLLRQTVQVKLDRDGDNSVRTFKANELCTVPGGHPKDGEVPVSTFKYVPEPEEDEDLPEDVWAVPADEPAPAASEPSELPEIAEPRRNRRHRQKKVRPQQPSEPKNVEKVTVRAESKPEEKTEARRSERPSQRRHGRGGAKNGHTEAKGQKSQNPETPIQKQTASPEKNTAPAGSGEHKRNNKHRYYHGKPKHKPSGEAK